MIIITKSVNKVGSVYELTALVVYKSTAINTYDEIITHILHLFKNNK